MKILIPLDGSKFSEAIISPAGDLVANSGAEVHLISMVRESDVHSSWYELPGRNAPHSATTFKRIFLIPGAPSQPTLKTLGDEFDQQECTFPY